MRKLIIYSKYDSYFDRIANLVEDYDDKVCYVTLNKTYEFLVSRFNDMGVGADNFYFVDAITGMLDRIEDTEDCDYVSSPARLDEISDAIKKGLKKDCKLVILDSLSNFFDYYPEEGPEKNVLVEFLKSFAEDVEDLDVVFVVKREDEENFILQKALSFFDSFEGDFVPLGI